MKRAVQEKEAMTKNYSTDKKKGNFSPPPNIFSKHMFFYDIS
jgi:hypothetical protein